MKPQDKIAIDNLRMEGKSAGDIALILHLSPNTVRSHIRRHPDLPGTRRCMTCGAFVAQPTGRREKKFCSDICRRSWWNAHRHLVNHKSGQSLQCENCGKTFYPNGHKSGRFCSRTCYLSHIRKEVSNNDQ